MPGENQSVTHYAALDFAKSITDMKYSELIDIGEQMNDIFEGWGDQPTSKRSWAAFLHYWAEAVLEPPYSDSPAHIGEQ